MIDYIFFSNEYCYLCKENKTKTYICKECNEKIEYINGYREIKNGICLYPVFYNNFIKDIIKKFKYNKDTYLVKPISEILYNFYIEKDLEIDYISYIPMFAEDEYKRGYNQSLLMAKYFSKITGIEVIEILSKTRSTKHQNKLEKKDRFINLIDSFKMSSKIDIGNKNILIIDDIVTTGSTFNAVSEEILKSYNCKLTFLALSSSRLEENGE